MPISVDQLLSEAREWIDTPYHDQGTAKGKGCDCVGLFQGLGINLGIRILGDHNYPENAPGSLLLSYLEKNCRLLSITDLEEAPPGAVLAFNTREDPGPHHLALRTEKGLLHAWGRHRGSERPGKVVEHGLMWADRLHSVWWHTEVVWQPR